MNKKVFEDDLIAGMQHELRKQASAEQPDLVKAGECLHAALEIFESAGLQNRAYDVLKIMAKIAQNKKQKPIQEMPSIDKLLSAGITQYDIREFKNGNPLAKAKFNIVLRGLGMNDHALVKFLGANNVMPEDEAKSILDPNRSFGKIDNWIKDLKPSGNSMSASEPLADINGPKITMAKNKSKVQDHHTHSLTSEKMIANLKNHGTMFNLTDDGLDNDMADVSQPQTFNQEYDEWEKKQNKGSKGLDKDDLDPDFFGESLDLSLLDEDLLDADINDVSDLLEAFDKDGDMPNLEDVDFEDELSSLK